MTENQFSGFDMYIIEKPIAIKSFVADEKHNRT